MAQRLRLPPPLLFPSTTSRPLRLAAQINYDPSNPANPPYVLHAVSHRSGYLFAASDDTIRAFSPNLQPLGQLPVSQRGITSVVKGAGKDSNAVFVTAKDGTVSCWDLRDLTKEAFKLKGVFLHYCALLCALLTKAIHRSGKTRAGYLTASQSSDQSCLAVGTELHQYEAMIDIW